MDMDRVKELIRNVVDSVTSLALELTLPQTKNLKTDNDDANNDTIDECPRASGDEPVE